MSSKQGLVQLNKDLPKSNGKAPIEEREIVGQKKEMQVVKVLRKIQGHVIDEELWNLKRCLVGVMASMMNSLPCLRTDGDKEESISSSSSETDKFQSPVRSNRSWTQVEEDATEAIYPGKENIKENVMMKEVGGRHMGEAEILGSSPLMRSAVIEKALKGNVFSVEDKRDSFVSSGVKGKPSWVEIVSNHTEGDGNGLVSPVEELDPSPQRSLENINYLGQQSTGSGSIRSLAKNKSSWVVSIDEKMNSSYNKISAAETGNLVSPGAQSEEDKQAAFFPELSFAKRKKKEKRYPKEERVLFF
ncbi:hypothetical protein V6N12_057515 [Hibiscus sabdariffa]|uniref:Uncharacterized protein n=1 Tax=Hibiscus sabdariffa TaxID=183260 RepID=A0ABR2C779_9ROSI